MGDKSSIQWTDTTWNPLRGCSRVSEGCVNCYAEGVAARFSKPGQPYHGLALFGKNGPKWTGLVRLVIEHLGDPLRWKRSRRIFVNSMSDLFHESLTNEEIAAVFGIMAGAPRHIFQALTKRHKRMGEWFAWSHTVSEGRFWGPTMAEIGARMFEGFAETIPDVAEYRIAADIMWRACNNAAGVGLPLPNVHLGVSVEDQATAEERIPSLLRIPTIVPWVSYEPALGLVTFERWLDPTRAICRTDGHIRSSLDKPFCQRCGYMSRGVNYLGWIVVGGESGRNARPFDLAWAHSVVDECAASATPVFVKQLGAKPGVHPDRLPEVDRPTRVFDSASGLYLLKLKDGHGGEEAEWPMELRNRREWPGETRW